MRFTRDMSFVRPSERPYQKRLFNDARRPVRHYLRAVPLHAGGDDYRLVFMIVEATTEEPWTERIMHQKCLRTHDVQSPGELRMLHQGMNNPSEEVAKAAEDLANSLFDQYIASDPVFSAFAPVATKCS